MYSYNNIFDSIIEEIGNLRIEFLSKIHVDLGLDSEIIDTLNKMVYDLELIKDRVDLRMDIDPEYDLGELK